jgi:3-oxoacyl-[acyl-carrier protein] reductase
MKCALVTGGSRGIGRAICIRLGAQGYHILVNFRSNFPEAEQTLKTIQGNGGSGELLAFDVGNKTDISAILGRWISSHPEDSIEVLVNNAGIKEDVLMMWMKDEQWESVMRTNLDSFFYVTREVLNAMIMKRTGRIINVVSLSGLKGLPGQTNYSASKGGVIAATKALAQEVGRRGITVNAVAPGFIKTDMTENISEKEVKAIIPVNRFGTPEEVAHLVGFLASPESGYITGEVISINGGMYS